MTGIDQCFGLTSFICQFGCGSLVDGLVRKRRYIGIFPAVRAGRLPCFAVRRAITLAAFTRTLDFKALVIGSNGVVVRIRRQTVMVCNCLMVPLIDVACKSIFV